MLRAEKDTKYWYTSYTNVCVEKKNTNIFGQSYYIINDRFELFCPRQLNGIATENSVFVHCMYDKIIIFLIQTLLLVTRVGSNLAVSEFNFQLY